ncbi:MAG: hypothetical protein ACE5FQ_13470, partial [Thiogranum sp.]
LNRENPPVSIIGICAGAAPDTTDTPVPGDILETALPALLDTIDQVIRELSPARYGHFDSV